MNACFVIFEVVHLRCLTCFWFKTDGEKIFLSHNRLKMDSGGLWFDLYGWESIIKNIYNFLTVIDTLGAFFFNLDDLAFA